MTTIYKRALIFLLFFSVSFVFVAKAEEVSTNNNSGFEFSAVYKGEAATVIDGGLRKRTVYLENWDLKLDIDAEKMAGLSGTQFFVYALGNRGADSDNSPSLNVGDLQGTSNIETAYDDFKLYEVWVQKSFLNDRASVLLGLHDLNSEFYVTPSSGNLFNASFGIGKEFSQSGTNGPSIFPVTAMSGRVKYHLTETAYLLGAVFNAQAGDPDHPVGTHIRAGDDGALLIVEAGTEGDQKISAGAWTYTDNVQRGSYLLFDQKINDTVSGFVRFGKIFSDIDQTDSCLSFGVQVKAPFSARLKDTFSLGYTEATPSENFKSAANLTGERIASEKVFEINYKFQLNEHLAFQPDFQFIQNSSMQADTDDAKTLAVRIEFGF